MGTDVAAYTWVCLQTPLALLEFAALQHHDKTSLPRAHAGAPLEDPNTAA